jgi:4-alpha-glucanotransferase
VVAGVPPDYFSKTGQLWGNPLYNWDRLANTDYRWWIQRMRSAFEIYDLVRIDHFRGFEAYWEVPAGAENAINGRWAPGPAATFFESVKRQLGDLPIVAEDLGLITPGVHQLRDRFGLPGMRVLQFGFDSPNDGFHRPENFPSNSVAYTGTHDNETLIGWYLARQKAKLKDGSRDLLDQYLSADSQFDSIHWQLITMVMNSASHTAIVPLQDILGLDNSARMNLPGTAHGNWQWRVLPEQLSDSVAAHLRVITEHSGRLQLVYAV